jgi:hemoglobin-like flavoprotein
MSVEGQLPEASSTLDGIQLTLDRRSVLGDDRHYSGPKKGRMDLRRAPADFWDEMFEEFDGIEEEFTEGKSKSKSSSEINVSSFDELVVSEKEIQAANDVWKMFLATAESREAAGEVIYSALFESAPSLQSLFVTPRAVQAMKFMNGIASFVTSLDEPEKLKILVETLGFGHLHLDVTVPRVVIFRDAILDLFAVELAEKFGDLAREGWTKLLNYVGGAIIYIKANYAERIITLLESWKIATEGKAMDSGLTDSSDDGEHGDVAKNEKEAGKPAGGWGNKSKTSEDLAEESAADKSKNGNAMSANQVPTTYNEMFRFNSAVMGFGNALWMQEVLDVFHNIVTNVANSARLQEECDVLALRLAKVVKGKKVNFAEYKSCMLASLRSLLPKDWSTLHEVSWSWLWANVERILQKNMGNPEKWERGVSKLLGSLDETQAFEIRKDIYARFFAAAPAGQDYFKQSNTYLHFIADRVMQMTLEIYQTPVKMVDDISALGLRHVGYAIPTEFFGPFVSACVEVVQSVTKDVDTVEGFRWSLGLVGKMLVRTITEGSTIVMKAINSNNTKQLSKAISCAPRGERNSWLLLVQVGTQNISPLLWSVESGALEAANAIITDLLSIRADRDKYYYGMDDLFKRHPEIVQTLTNDAPTLLPTLLDGLIWRSRTTEAGLRRANYYLRHLLIDAKGKFSPTLSWVAKANDPKLVCHPLLVLLSDAVWSGLACRAFLFRKTWFLFTLSVFIAGQSILKHIHDGENTKAERIAIFAFRAFIYSFSLVQLLYTHATKIWKGYRMKDTAKVLGCIPIPKYLVNWQAGASLTLLTMLELMLVTEPIFWCISNNGGKLFNQICPESEGVTFAYSVFSMLAMLLYFLLLLDLAVLSTKVSAYVLVCLRMVAEVGLFLLALVAVIVTFSSSISVIEHDQYDYAGIHKGVLSLLEITMKMFDGRHYEGYESDPLVLVCVFFFIVVVSIFLTNMLVAQLTCAYEAVYNDMVGYARLERMNIIVTTMPSVSDKSWSRFKDKLGLDQKTEFNAGDLGVSGGLQILEPANANPTTEDQIARFGGSTSPEMQWPAEQEGEGDENDRFERVEALIQKTLKRITKGSGGAKGGGSGSGSGDNSGSAGNGTNQGDEEAGSEEDDYD